MIVVFDTETNGLIANEAVPLDQQPEIIEFAGVKVRPGTFEVVDQLSFLVRPAILPLPDEVVKITQITSDMLLDQPRFVRRVPLLQEFFLGVTTVVAHNCKYDIDMLANELRRVDMLTRFPWPCHQVCTVDCTKELFGKRMKLSDLYQTATGRTPLGAHRAMNDVQMLLECLPWLVAQDVMP